MTIILFSVTIANAESLRKRIEYLAESSKAECDKLKFDLVSIRDRSLFNAESLKKTDTLLPDIRSGLGRGAEDFLRSQNCIPTATKVFKPGKS